jgi:type II secretory pathway component PulF
LVEAGERSGSLGPALSRLGEDLMLRRELADEVRNALVYPLFLSITATAGILVLLLVVVPSLEALIGERGGQSLPAITRLVLGLSAVLREDGMVIATGLFGLLTVGIAALLTSPGRRRADAAILCMPVVGDLIRTLETGRFARAFHSLLAGGLVAPTALRLASNAVRNRAMRESLGTAHTALVSGTALSDALAIRYVFADDALSLIRLGERTGRLTDTVARIASLYETRGRRRLKALTKLLTPAMTVLFGGVTGLIVYAMLSTILGLNTLVSP